MTAAITCTELVDLLLEFTGGDLDEVQRAVFEHHLCGCTDCVVTVETYQATIVVTRSLTNSDAGLTPGFEARLRAALKAEGLG